MEADLILHEGAEEVPFQFGRQEGNPPGEIRDLIMSEAIACTQHHTLSRAHVALVLRIEIDRIELIAEIAWSKLMGMVVIGLNLQTIPTAKAPREPSEHVTA